MKTEIFLIRHAEPLKDFDKSFNGFEDKQFYNQKISLSRNGEKQAKAISKLSDLSNVDVVISSEYIRSISTAKYIVNKNRCPFFINSDFTERRIGNDKVDREFWLHQMLDSTLKTDNGESQLEVRNRMVKGINDIILKYSGKKIVVVSHAAAITFLLMNWCELEDVKLDGKIRKLVFKRKVIINDSFRTPDIFKLTFINNDIDNIERLNIS